MLLGCVQVLHVLADHGFCMFQAARAKFRVRRVGQVLLNPSKFEASVRVAVSCEKAPPSSKNIVHGRFDRALKRRVVSMMGFHGLEPRLRNG